MIIELSTSMMLGVACARVDDEAWHCYEYEEDQANGGGIPSPPPNGPGDTTSETDCDEDIDECDREGGEIVPACRQLDEAVDEIARRSADELSNLCSSTGNEWGAAIYRDGDDMLQISNFYTGCTDDPDGCRREISHELGYERQGISFGQIVGVMHCHPSGSLAYSNDDFEYIMGTEISGTLAYAQNHADPSYLEGRTNSEAVSELRGYIVGENGALREMQTDNDAGCEENVND